MRFAKWQSLIGRGENRDREGERKETKKEEKKRKKKKRRKRIRSGHMSYCDWPLH